MPLHGNQITAVFPDATMKLNVWHFIMRTRYTSAILNPSKNPHWKEPSAGTKMSRRRGSPSTFEKWVCEGMVWSTGACQVHEEQLKHAEKSSLISSTHGSYHIHLVDKIAKLFNHFQLEEKITGMRCLPELKDIPSDEHFGLVTSSFASSFGGLLDIKAEDSESLVDLDLTGPKLLEALSADSDVANLALQSARSKIVEELNIDPQLLSQPQTPSNA
ncbi:hypothetical protein BDR07DRAFT_1381287 [Suillus spraguei]|nr:hypothetical protein BDR07DRAFT_1381287 [Suillus spraguei]